MNLVLQIFYERIFYKETEPCLKMQLFEVFLKEKSGMQCT